MSHPLSHCPTAKRDRAKGRLAASGLLSGLTFIRLRPCAGSPRTSLSAGAAALDPHRAEIDAAARAEDAGAYERALRKFAKAGKCEALRLRREKEEAA